MKTKIYKPKTISVTRNYSPEVIEHLKTLAKLYRKPVHQFVVDCISTGSMVRTGESVVIDMNRFQGVQQRLRSNVTQAKNLIEYVKSKQSTTSLLGSKIFINNHTYDPVVLLEGLITKIDDVINPIINKQLGKHAESSATFILTKKRLSTLDRFSKVNRKSERGALRGRRLKLELSQNAYDTLKTKAYEFFEARSYSNDIDNAKKRPNDTAAILKIIYDAEQYVSGYDISTDDIDSIYKIGSDYNEGIADFNKALAAGGEFKPKDLFEVLQRFYIELKKLNITDGAI
ncbi:hypothetical protein [Pseudomonas sp. HY7a-MNA-CIBAN-0227]|uniref:hypothetical protein n=1 Tax=Pseudomonas sp. HY7a-MNA-CIBAN-0227 TaxID=3140474 RepID=UPI0033290BAA